jgi:hypothetical protein
MKVLTLTVPLAALLGFGAVDPAKGGQGDDMLINKAEWKDGKPVALSAVSRPPVLEEMPFQPGESDWKFSHHPFLAAFGNRLFAMWSSAPKDEDSPGQRVVYSVGDGNGQWTPPKVLMEPERDTGEQPRVLTAAGFYQHGGTLVAYIGDYSSDRKSTRLLARTTTDGMNWSGVRDLQLPVCPNHPPQKLASGRLILSGNTAFPYTDDPSGLSGWKMAGIYPASWENFRDNPGTFWKVAQLQGWPVYLCEGSFFQENDGTVRMLLRVTGEKKNDLHWYLWETVSSDDGESWSQPRKTGFSNTDTKFHFGRLPDGRFYSVGSPVGSNRLPLVVSTSRDGVTFDRSFIMGETPYERRYEGKFKGGNYGYPHSIVFQDRLWVIVSRQKEAIAVYSVLLKDLKENGNP